MDAPRGDGSDHGVTGSADRNAAAGAGLYDARLAEISAALADLEARSTRISSLRGVTFLAAAGLALARAFRPVPPAVWMVAGAFAAAFVGLVIAHAILVTRSVELELRARLVGRGVKRIARELGDDGATKDSPDRGQRFVVPDHAYAGDLDLFGPSSLYALVCSAETGSGQRVLARWLSEPASAEEIARRHEAVKELAGLARFREDLAVRAAESGTSGRDADPFLTWAEDARPVPSAALFTAGRVLVPITLGLAAASEALAAVAPALRAAWLVPLFAQLGVLAATRNDLAPVLAIAGSREEPFGRYTALFRLIEETSFRAPRLAALRAVLVDGGATRAIQSLTRIVGFAELRHAGIVAVLANIFLIWDVWVGASLVAWRRAHGAAMRKFVEAMAELEALASLATFAAEHPDYVYPEVDGGEPRFIAEALGHPLIATARRVSNDVTIPRAGSALMITGSNMSGKSTLLRAVGVNAALALAGAPVCARRLSMAECRVRTSMRIADSLDQGVSHFYAELGRLKAVVDAVDRGERVLFLLDEVLHGTNSRERNLGARAVIKKLVAAGAIGAVSSHDLGLADIEGESGGRVVNVHFQEAIDDRKIVFDYKLKPGVVTSSNALRLMKLVGIAVDLPDA